MSVDLYPYGEADSALAQMPGQFAAAGAVASHQHGPLVHGEVFPLPRLSDMTSAAGRIRFVTGLLKGEYA
jgi:hypothetical protein